MLFNPFELDFPKLKRPGRRDHPSPNEPISSQMMMKLGKDMCVIIFFIWAKIFDHVIIIPMLRRHHHSDARRHHHSDAMTSSSFRCYDVIVILMCRDS